MWSSRSRSRTVESSNNHLAILNPSHQFSPTTGSSLPSPLPDANNSQSKQEMTTTLTRQTSATPHDLLAHSSNGVGSAQAEIQDDDESSSLSDLEDGVDDQTDTISADQDRAPESEFDSEAETERLERTPQKPNASAASALPEKSPSKLAQEILVEGAAEDVDRANQILANGLEDLTPLQSATHHDLADLEDESPSRKRKRTVSVVSSLSDTDEPLAKRSHSARYQAPATNSSSETINNQPTDIGQEAEPTEQVADDTIIAEDGQEQELLEVAVPARGRKGRKGKRKGKKAAHEAELEHTAEPAEEVAEEDKEVAETFVEEEEEGTRDEEVAKKKLAFDALTKIEKEFLPFREKHINEQLRLITDELELLKQPLSTHQEYLAQLRCVDDYRDKKIRYEDTIFKFKMGSLKVRTVAERQQFHSQYFQEVRDIRDKTLEDCYEKIYSLQRERRRFGADESNYTHVYHPKRAQQIAQQSAYNLEVSILSGVAKHVGFPAAPELPTLETDDIDGDLRSMKIPERPLQPRISLRDAERAIGTDASFYAQNAWANPLPAHAVVSQSQPFVTPSAPNRIVSNGSTIVDVNMMSAPNSQHPTPQHNHVAETAKPSPLGFARNMLTEATSNEVATVLSAPNTPQVLPPTASHGEEATDSPGPPPAGVSISVGGGNNRFPP